MKKYIFIIIILFPIVITGQTYYGYPKPPIKVDVTVKKEPADFATTLNEGLKARAALQQAEAANRAADVQQEMLELERNRQRQDFLEKKRLQEEEKRIKEDNNPNSILNKFKNTKLKQENEDLKNKLIQMEILLAEKEKLEKEKAEAERLEKEKLEKSKTFKKVK